MEVKTVAMMRLVRNLVNPLSTGVIRWWCASALRYRLMRRRAIHRVK